MTNYHMKNKKGLTLTEILITLAISGLLMTGILGYYINTATGLFVTEQKMNINQDIRTLTNEMTKTARESNGLIAFKSFANTDRDSADDYLTTEMTGDMVVFYKTGDLDSSGKRPYTDLVGYYRAPDDPSDPNSTGPVRRFEINLSTPSNAAMTTLLPDETTINNYPAVVQISRGLSNGKLFYVYKERSVIVNGQIYHGNAAKRVTDTYNFTISPRG